MVDEAPGGGLAVGDCRLQRSKREVGIVRLTAQPTTGASTASRITAR